MTNEMTTIALNQLTNSNNGRNRLVAMIGASNFLRDEENYTISFKFAAKAKNKVNYCGIKLNSRDLYDIKFVSIRGANIKTVSVHTDLYADMLKGVFETETGLYLSLH